MPPSVFVVFTPVPLPPTDISHNKLHTNTQGNLRLVLLCSVCACARECVRVCVCRVKVNKEGESRVVRKVIQQLVCSQGQEKCHALSLNVCLAKGFNRPNTPLGAQ